MSSEPDIERRRPAVQGALRANPGLSRIRSLLFAALIPAALLGGVIAYQRVRRPPATLDPVLLPAEPPLAGRNSRVPPKPGHPEATADHVAPPPTRERPRPRTPIEVREPATDTIEVAPVEVLFGGRTLAWWSAELAASAAAVDLGQPRDRFDLLTRRARANGLEVETSTSGVRGRQSATLTSRARRRLRGAPPLIEGDASALASTSTAALRISADQALAQLEQDLRNISRAPKSRGGPRIILAPRRGDLGVLRVQFAAGAIHDRGLAGLTRVAQHAMIAASTHERYTKLAADLDRAGASLAVETSISECAFELQAPASAFDQLARILIRMILSPALDEAKLREAKSRARNAHHTDADWLATMFAAIAFNAHGFARDPTGDPESIDALTAADIERHFRGALAPANATLVVTGAFDVARMRQTLASISGGAPEGFDRPTHDLAGTHHLRSAIELHVVAYPVRLKGPEEIAAAHLIAAMLEEHLLHRFRSAGAAYTVAASVVHRPWLDFIVLAVPFGMSPPHDIGRRIDDEATALSATDTANERTLTRNRMHVLGQLRSIHRDPSSLARALAAAGELEMIGPRTARAVATLDRARVLALAAEWLDKKRAIHLELSPEAE